MTYEQALTYANKLCRGLSFTARQKTLKEYNELCTKALLKKRLRIKVLSLKSASSMLINSEKTND